MSATLDARIDELAALRDGWLWGDGIAPTPHAIATARAVLGQLATEHPDVTRPRVYPTPDGDVQAEWTMGRVATDVRFPAQEGPLDASAVHVDSGSESGLLIGTADLTASASALATLLRSVADLS